MWVCTTSGARKREQGRHLTVARLVATRGGTLLSRGKMANGRVPVDPVWCVHEYRPLGDLGRTVGGTSA